MGRLVVVARAVSRKTPIYFMVLDRRDQLREPPITIIDDTIFPLEILRYTFVQHQIKKQVMLQLFGLKSEFGGCNMRPASLSDKTMRSCKLTQAQKQSTQSTPKISTNARIQFDVSPCVDLNA